MSILNGDATTNTVRRILAALVVCAATSAVAEFCLANATARSALERDWLFQVDGRATYENVSQHINRARDLAARLRSQRGEAALAAELERLDRLASALDSRTERESNSDSMEELYLAVRRVKRQILLKQPAVEFSETLFIDQPYPRFPKDRPWPYDRRGGQVCRHENSHRNGMMAVPGGKLVILEELSPQSSTRHIGPASAGSYWRPDVSFDGRRILFCFKPQDEKGFHLYEVGIDGRDLRQLTQGDYDDIDPIYLPDGHIMFVTTRCHTYVRCMPHANSYVLARCDADGKNIYLVSRGNECDWLPALLDDGRVIYSRWEYTDKPLWRIQSLWTTNADGSNTAVFWGNQSVWPDHLAQPRQIPGTHRVMFTAVGHHDWFAGSIGIVDPRAGREFPKGLTKVTSDVAWPEVGNGPVDPVESPHYQSPGRYDAYQTPYPLSEDLFLVSARRSGDEKFRLYLADIDGNLELIYEGTHNVWHAMPLKPRRQPPEQPDRVRWPRTGRDRREPAPGYFYSADVCEGVPDLPRERVKYLRVFQQDHTTFSEGAQTTRWGGPCLSIIQEDGVKRILGTVPVNEDGSVYFQAPAGKMLYFQLLDEHYRALQTMRSFTGVMPGETRGCVGCHEMRSTTPPNQPALALRHLPAWPAPPPWGDESIGYERFVQPVLDRYCGDCHQGDGEGRDELDLTLRPGYGFMKEPYLTLVAPAIWIEPRIADLTVPDPAKPGVGLAGILRIESYSPEEIIQKFKWHNQPTSRGAPAIRTESLVGKYATLRPMTALSYRSPLIEMVMSGKHYDVKVDPVSLRRLIAWVDAMGPYRGEDEIRAIPDPEFGGIEELAIRPRTRTAPRISRPSAMQLISQRPRSRSAKPRCTVKRQPGQ
jgi:hypothetical protein